VKSENDILAAPADPESRLARLELTGWALGSVGIVGGGEAVHVYRRSFLSENRP